MADLRVVIVGAGPAGTRAAETLVRAGLRPVVIDEEIAAAARSIAASRKISGVPIRPFTARKRIRRRLCTRHSTDFQTTSITGRRPSHGQSATIAFIFSAPRQPKLSISMPLSSRRVRPTASCLCRAGRDRDVFRLALRRYP